MRSFVACFALLLTALGAAPSPSPEPSPQPLAQLRLRSIGPATAGGRLSSVAGTDANPNLYYVGSAGGGVWKTTNFGVDWTPVFDKEPVASIGSVAIDPSNEKVVWAGTGEANPRNDVSPGAGMYQSTDGGATWTLRGLQATTAIGAISIDPRNGKNVVVAALGDPFADSDNRGVYRTTDGGATWTNVLALGPQTGASDVVRAQRRPDLLFAGMWQFRRTGWSVRSGGPQDGLYRSRDGGATWEHLTGNGLPSDELGRIGLAVAPSNPNRVFALIQSKLGILWRSDDAGDHWQLVSTDTNVNERPFYFSKIWVDPSNQDHVFSSSVHLTESTDGGKTWHNTGRRIHGDHHAMWIAADGKRIVEGNDGGVAFSHDGGATWEWRNVIPIGQYYHIGFDRANPYRVCAPLQDNGGWCAPNNSLGAALAPADWESVGGGDAAWIVPEPKHPEKIWISSGGGNNGGETELFDEHSKQTAAVAISQADQNVVPPAEMQYRFNWETPLALDPFDAQRMYSAGNALFETRDRGRHWTRISPDLTRNERSHEQISGGETLEGTGAETSETILYIEPSSVARGELWIGTDDGLVQLTRDGGRHWKNVTPAGPPPFGRIAGISASARAAGTAYVVDDAHMTGDRTPYVFKTTDFGRHWTKITAGLPGGEFARSVREDPRNPSLLYLGTEFGLYVSLDKGAHWQPFRQNLPVASVRDIRVQPDFNDLLIGTHGRDGWILDDVTPLQQLTRAQRSPAYLFAVRRAYEYQIHSGRSNYAGAGENPPYGAIVTFYLKNPAKRNPVAEIVDQRGRIVRRFGSHQESGKPVFELTNQSGLNRFSWDLTEDKPAPWDATPDWNQFDSGALVVPGTYTVQLHVDGTTLRAPVVVTRDPRDPWGLMDHQARYELERGLLDDWSRIDRALNELSAVQTDAAARKSTLEQTGSGDALAARLDAVRARGTALQASITSNPRADQDDDFLRDLLRERVQSLLFTFDTFRTPTAAQQHEGTLLHALTGERMRAVDAFVRGDVQPLNTELRKRGLQPIGSFR